MKNLTIYVRSDLKMRKGKMAAQSAHAAMKLLFESMHRFSDRMLLCFPQLQELQAFLANPVIDIVMVKDEAALNEILNKDMPYSIITDSGRTEFHGVPTVTCAAQGIFSPCEMIELVVKHNYSSDIKAKQLFVFNKDVPLSKEKACQQAVLSCVKQLYSLMNVLPNGERYFDLNEKRPLIEWIMSAFAKIALSTKTLQELLDLEATLTKRGFTVEHIITDDNHCLCISPQYPSEIDPFTGELSLI